MHSVSRTVKVGSPLGRAFNSTAQRNATLLQSCKATSLPHPVSATTASISTNTRRSGHISTSVYKSSLSRSSAQWTGRCYTTQPNGTPSPVVQDLERVLKEGDYAGFQQACSTAAKKPTKDVCHFLLKTLSEQPQAFASPTEIINPLASALGILTDMSREANMLGNSTLQPDRETLLLLLKVATSSSSSSSQLQKGGERAIWESVRNLVDAIRHGRLPAVMSADQWELPDLNVPLDQELWKAMFESVNGAAVGNASVGAVRQGLQFQDELNTTTYMMADQVTRLQDLHMDEQLWTYVVEAFGNNGSAARLKDILPRLPDINHASPTLYSSVAEALANCGSAKRGTGIMNTLYNTHDHLPTSAPFAALARQHVKTGNYEAIRRDFKLWETKGQSSAANDVHLIDMYRSMLSASALALNRMVDVLSKTFKDRQADTLPDNVLAGMVSPTQLTRFQFSEASYLWRWSQQSMAAIPKDGLTAEDYDTMMRITTRLNLLQPWEWSLKDYAEKLIPEMKQHGLKPLKSTYYTLMETMARTREYGASREAGQVVTKVMKVFEQMTTKGGHTATHPHDFQPLLEACFGLYSHSPFVAGQWMYSNQLYPVSKDALKRIERMMEKALASASQDGDADSSNSTIGTDVTGAQRYHDSTTIATVLAGLAHGDELDELITRWDDLILQGVERDGKLYQTIIAASHVQEKMARYILRKVRFEMARELPPVAMTPQIFAGLLNCCIRVQDAISARSLIAQCSSSGEIRKTAEWYMPMVRACLTIDGMEDEGVFLLEEMKKNNMRMDSFSGSFYEFLMEYFVTKRMDYSAGREVFKDFVKSEQNKVEELMAARRSFGVPAQPGGFVHSGRGMSGDDQLVLISDRELAKLVERTQDPVEHLVERVEISPRTASMLNLLILSHIRERLQLLDHERGSGFDGGSQERLKDAQVVIHYLAGEAKFRSRARRRTQRQETMAEQKQQHDTPTIPDTDSTPSETSVPLPAGSNFSSLLFNSPRLISSPVDFGIPGAEKRAPSSHNRLLFINKYVLGEYIDTCIKEGSAEMLEEADWALNKVMPRVIDSAKVAKDTQRLRQALESARARNQQQQHQQHEFVDA
ncbi:hypothetical protein BGZ98_004704 [Dissophora globulifera]|nr:hypothetical protein BGZ98_004704 [Dissophora globulifera]